MQSILETDDVQIVISSTKILFDTINDLLLRICENRQDDEQLIVKCDILRQKLDMLLDTLKEEESGIHDDDELFKTLNEIAKKSASEIRIVEP